MKRGTSKSNSNNRGNKLLKQMSEMSFEDMSYKKLKEYPMFQDLNLLTVQDFATVNDVHDCEQECFVMRCLAVYEAMKNKPFKLTRYTVKANKGWKCGTVVIFNKDQLELIVEFVQAKAADKIHSTDIFITVDMYSKLKSLTRIKIYKRLGLYEKKPEAAKNKPQFKESLFLGRLYSERYLDSVMESFDRKKPL